MRIPDGPGAILLSVVPHDQNPHFDEVVNVIRALETAGK